MPTETRWAPFRACCAQGHRLLRIVRRVQDVSSFGPVLLHCLLHFVLLERRRSPLARGTAGDDDVDAICLFCLTTSTGLLLELISSISISQPPLVSFLKGEILRKNKSLRACVSSPQKSTLNQTWMMGGWEASKKSRAGLSNTSVLFFHSIFLY